MGWFRRVASAGGALTAIAGGSTVTDDLANYGTIARSLGPEFFRWAFVFLGIAIIVAANWKWICSTIFRNWLPTWRIRLEREDSLPMRRLISVGDAARLMAARVDGTLFGRRARQLHRPAEDLAAFYARHIARRDGVVIYGTEPLSETLKAIPRDVVQRLEFSSELDRLVGRDDDLTEFSGLKVKKHQIDAMIADHLKHANV